MRAAIGSAGRAGGDRRAGAEDVVPAIALGPASARRGAARRPTSNE
jgi:hypothetical protein